MSVYVDRLMAYPRTEAWPYGKACHIWADSLEELHAFADRLGLKRRWFQDERRFPHYDLTERRRALAVSRGAVEVGREELRDYVRARQSQGVPP